MLVKRTTKNRKRPVAKRPMLRKLAFDPTIKRQFPPHLMTSQRKRLHNLIHSPHFRRRRLQKFQTRRRIKKQILQHDLRPRRSRSFAKFRHLRPLHMEVSPQRITTPLRRQRQSRHRRHRRQCLPAKTHRRYRRQILRTMYLRRRMTQNTHLRILRTHPTSVVAHTKPLPPCLLKLNLDFIRPRIQGIFYQFLDGTRGSLQHLASRQLIAQCLG